MSDPVATEITAGVAVITIDAPPVNVTSQAVRQGLMAALDAASGARRVVLTGSGRIFVAGADATEFDAPPVAPHLPEITARIAAFPVPVIAAINGAALGGGLELALACAARVAVPGARLGLPEVSLGLVPGAGGTQRLPRLIGLAPALALISEGKAISAEEALALGLVDALAEDARTAALTLPLPARTAPSLSPDAAVLAAATAKVARQARGQIAPLEAIDCVGAATRMTLEQGLAFERETFLRLRDSDQARALRHLFFAERQAQARGRNGGAAIETAVVVGGGTMGATIAYALAGVGIHVTTVETDAETRDAARARISGLYAEAVARGKLTEAAAQALLASGHGFQVGFEGLPPAQIAIEAVVEDLAIKRQVFAALARSLPETALLATNTSYLSPEAITADLPAPGRCLGLHFFAPAHLMKLVEVIRTQASTPETLATALRLSRRLGKIAVPAGVCDGFIGNRILTRYRQACDVMLLEGALPREIDAAMRDFGMAMGPYEVQDLSGLDIAHANRKRLNWNEKPSVRYIAIADRIVEETGRLGRKTGAGWYDYPAGRPEPSAEIEALVIAESARVGVARRAFSAAEIAERALIAMMCEGLAILQEGIAEKPADIDLVLVHGYGFPRWRGGPMHLAARRGAKDILSRISAYAASDPISWPLPEVSPLNPAKAQP